MGLDMSGNLCLITSNPAAQRLVKAKLVKEAVLISLNTSPNEMKIVEANIWS